MKLDRVYENDGNLPLIRMMSEGDLQILDVGCGAGNNASLAKSLNPRCIVSGITHSEAEAKIAQEKMQHCWTLDIERCFPDDLASCKFDLLIFSHVLEHLRDPAGVLKNFTSLLRPGGTVLIAVPNILSWRMRLQFLGGGFEYEATGVLDDTHLRFFTFFTADHYLLAESDNLYLEEKSVTGSFPLWWLRRYFLPTSWCDRIDQWSCRRWPNLFGNQVLIRAVKR